MKNFKSLEKALLYFHQKGFATEFKISFDTITCVDKNLQYDTFDFDVLSTHEAEDDGDTLHYFLVQTNDGKKGYMLNDYGPDSDPVSIEMIDKLQLKNLSKLD